MNRTNRMTAGVLAMLAIQDAAGIDFDPAHSQPKSRPPAPLGEGEDRARAIDRKRFAAKGRVCTNGAAEKERRRRQMERGLISADIVESATETIRGRRDDRVPLHR